MVFWKQVHTKKMMKNNCYVYGPNAQVPFHLHFGQEILDRMKQHDDIVALINSDTGESITYRELAQKTVDIALSLVRLGVEKGDVVSVCSEKSIDMMATILGVFCSGATFSPTDNTFGTDQFLHRAKITEPKVMFCSPNAFEQYKTSIAAESIQHCIVYGDDNKHGGLSFKEFLIEGANVDDFLPIPVDGWKDYLLILFSSGTTGLPKGVPYTHLGFLVNSLCKTNKTFRGKPLMITREWHNNYGLLYTLAGLREGATVVFSATNNHEEFLSAIQKHRGKYLQLTPSSVMDLVKSPVLQNYDLSSVEGILTSSTPIMAEQVQAVKKRLPNLKSVYQIYGLCEASCVCNELHAPQGPRSGSVGTPAPGLVMKVVDLKTQQPVGPGERGEICLKSPSLTPGYLSVDRTRFSLDSEGFYRTGDVGYFDADGYFYVVNRIKEMIKFNDIAVAPAELESLLMMHPDVLDAGVVGAHNLEFGEVPTALVVLKTEGRATPDELVQFIDSKVTFRMRLAGGARLVERLPRTAAGKLDRPALRDMLDSLS